MVPPCSASPCSPPSAPCAGGEVGTASTIFGLSRAAAGFTIGLALRRAWPAHAALLHRAAAWSLGPLILLAWASAFDLAWIAAIVAVMLLAIPARGIIHTALNRGPLRFLGDISYSIYLWHAPVHLAIEGVLLRAGVDLPHLSAASRLAIGAAMLLATILIATLGYRGFEVPARHWLRARLAT